MSVSPQGTIPALARLTDRLHRSDFYPALSAALRNCLAFDNIIVIAYRGTATPQVLFRESVDPRCHSQIDGTYVNLHYVLDPFFTALEQRQPRGLYRLDDIAPDKFRQTTYYLDYYSRTTIIDELALIAHGRDGWSLTVCLGRDATSGRRFERQALEHLRQHADLFCALVEQHFADFRPAAPAQKLSEVPFVDRIGARLKRSSGIELTSRQIEVGLLILQGHSSRSIALILGISWQTVKVFRKQLYARCQISSQAELFALLLPLVTSTTARKEDTIART